ncbi:hypothetical protein R3P38DRAFT_3186314 [Favolaschia claudopus]|uniref:Uncharacterized protein n=1 Tax=Favolaschia claudopus TaxID=2862362 RepID=A0AAW0C0Q9_9AGAR
MLLHSVAVEPPCIHASRSTDSLRWVSGDQRRVAECRLISCSASDIWFPLNDDAPTAWPPKITFPPTKARKISLASFDAMEGIVEQHSKCGRSSRTGSPTRVIPNRPSRSQSLSSVPMTPPNLWQTVAKPKDRESLGKSEKCLHATPNPARVRPAPPPGLVAKVPPSKQRKVARDDPPPYSSATPALRVYTKPPGLMVPSINLPREYNERLFLYLWRAQKRNNPCLPLVVSPFHPLRVLMPPLHWKSIDNTNRPFPKVEWNFSRPLLSSLNTRSRKHCDEAGERLSTHAVLSGKLRRHCRACSKDSLHKRLLLVRHWAANADAVFESAMALITEDDYVMGDATVEC